MVLAGITDLEFRQEADAVVVDGIRPADLLACLQAAARPPRKARILPGRQRLAHTATERLSAWEYSLASEARAKQGVCSRCLGKDVTPVTAIDGDRRCMIPWCSQCSATTSLLVRVSEYDRLPLRMEHFPRRIREKRWREPSVGKTLSTSYNSSLAEGPRGPIDCRMSCSGMLQSR